MYWSYVYSITVQKERDSIAFLKAYNKKIMTEDGQIIDEDNPVGIVIQGDETTSFGYVGEVSAETSEQMYAAWREITKKYELSMEYVLDGDVYILAFHQLHSGVDKPYNQIVIHNDVPRRRKSCRKKKDLKLRPATERDYGIYEPDHSSQESKSVRELIVTPAWIRHWRARAACIRFMYKKPWLPYEIEVDIVWRAFLLTINDIHAARGDEVPEVAHVFQITAMDPYLRPIQDFGEVPLLVPAVVTADLYRTIAAPGMVYNLDKNGTCLLREDLVEIIQLYTAARGYYLPKPRSNT